MRRLLTALRHSLHGLTAAYRSEAAFRQEVWLAAVLTPLACWLDVSGAERALLIFAAFLPAIVELLNTAVESVTDLITEQRHPLAKKAKDTASAAVLLALIAGGAIWLAILLPLLKQA